MPSLWFVVPAHGRFELARLCLRRLRWTCDALEDMGVRASAVVVASDENLDTARDLGFAGCPTPNAFLSARFNDGIQLACDPGYNPRPADFVVPCGSDDWVHPSLFERLPAQDTLVGFQAIAFVREDGRELTVRHLNYDGGSGIRIYPRQMMAQLDYRPADEDRRHGCDTSILTNLKIEGAVGRIEHRLTDGLRIVDWKTDGAQVNPYAKVGGVHRAVITGDPFEVLADAWPADALEEMAAHYGRVPVAA